MKNEKTFNEQLDQLIQTVEERVTREVTNYFVAFIQRRTEDLENMSPESTEFDYCEKLGRIKELQELTQALKELK
jgi:hypothetical protein